MSQFKSCFCDGSCKKSGICGGDRNMFIGPGLVDLNQNTINKFITRISGGINMNKAEEMRNLTEAANQEKMRQRREAIGDFYKKVAKHIESHAQDGYSDCIVDIPAYICKESFKDCLLDDGFGVFETDRCSFQISW